IPPTLRSASVGGESFQVFTFGAGLDYVTRKHVPLNGIAVPASAASSLGPHPFLTPAKLFAMSPNPARRLEEFEVAALKTRHPNDAICSITQQPSTTPGEELALQWGGKVHFFCAKAHAEDWLAARVAAD